MSTPNTFTQTTTVRGLLTMVMSDAILRSKGFTPPRTEWSVLRKPQDPDAPFRVTTHHTEVPRS